jgi:hypothetical protein
VNPSFCMHLAIRSSTWRCWARLSSDSESPPPIFTATMAPEPLDAPPSGLLPRYSSSGLFPDCPEPVSLLPVVSPPPFAHPVSASAMQARNARERRVLMATKSVGSRVKNL